MPDSTASKLPADLPAPEEELHVLLNIAQTGIMLLRPVHEAGGPAIVDLAWVHLNPAAQRMLQLPERPTESFLTLFPAADAAGVFGFYRDAFLSGQVARRQSSYQHDGLAGDFLLVAQRQGEVLVVSFTDPNDRPSPAGAEAQHDGRQDITGPVNFAYDATEQVRARRRAPALNEEQAATNEELRASNEEFQAANTALLTTQHQVQQAQATTELERARLFRLLMQAPAAICILHGPELRYELVNPGYQALFPGRPLLGRPLLEVLPELEGQAVCEALQDVYRTGQTHVDNRVHLRLARTPGADLDDYYFNYTFQVHLDANGRPDGVVVFAFDLTEQVRTQQRTEHLNQELEGRVNARTRELQQQQALLSQILSQVPAAIATLTGPEHRFSFFNAQYQRLSGHRAELGLTVAEALPEVVPQGFIALLDQVYATGEPFVGVERPAELFDAATGRPEPLFVDFVYQPLRDSQGTTRGVLAFVLDSTEKVRARQASEAAAQRLRVLTDALPVLIAYLDREQRYRFVNQAYRAWFNRDPAAVLGMTARELLGNEAYATVQGHIDRTLAGERLTFDARMTYREGFVKHIHTDYIPDVRDGEVHGFYSLVTDVTEQVLARQRVQELNEELAAINKELRAANEELRDTNDRLRHTNVDLDTFVYTASHDLKAPIANIEGLLHALTEQLPAPVQQDPDVTHLLGLMHGSVARFQRTLEHLTDVSKLQPAHTEPVEAVNLAALVEAVRQDLAPALAAVRGRLSVDVAACPTVRFSPKNLRSIVYNLLSNAIKYQDPGRPPRVQLHAHCAAGQVVLSVKDNGLGLTEAEQSKLFVMFRRLHTHVDGTGVGLYMVKRMVENAGGTVQVASEPGTGSTFTVVLPDSPGTLAGGLA